VSIKSSQRLKYTTETPIIKQCAILVKKHLLYQQKGGEKCGRSGATQPPLGNKKIGKSHQASPEEATPATNESFDHSSFYGIRLYLGNNDG